MQSTLPLASSSVDFERTKSGIKALRNFARNVYLWCFRMFLSAVIRRLVPDVIVRAGIRYLLSQRLKETKVPFDRLQKKKMDFINELKSMPIAIETDVANEQHYELPTEYFCHVLGKWKKYSSCFYRDAKDDLDTAEENMLEIYCDKLKIGDGMSVLELGCGWGSFTLFAAAKYPKSTFRAVSNSKTQNVFITQEAKKRGLTNVEVTTADMNTFQADAQYDRVVSVEMFEHMKNYGELLKKISAWMAPNALLFCHHFCHKTIAYHFEDNGDDDWMTRYFFTGGTMPSLDLLLYFQEHLAVESTSYINGKHYSKCLEMWLQNQDKCEKELAPIFKDVYGNEAQKWIVYWRLFYIACSELFNYNGGEEWGVAHYVFRKV